MRIISRLGRDFSQKLIFDYENPYRRFSQAEKGGMNYEIPEILQSQCRHHDTAKVQQSGWPAQA